MIDVTCHQCDAVYHSEDSHLGKHLRCSRCGSLVSIALPTVNAVVQAPSAAAKATIRESVPQAKHQVRPFRRGYLFAGIAIAFAVGLLLLRWQTTDRNQGTYAPKNIQNTSPSQENGRADDAASESKTPTVTSTETILQPPELQASQVEVRGEKPQAVRKDVQHADPRPTYYHSLPTNTPIGEDIETKGLGELTVENADIRTTMNLYTQANSDQKRQAHSKIVEMVLINDSTACSPVLPQPSGTC
jgi:hypothetical protein